MENPFATRKAEHAEEAGFAAPADKRNVKQRVGSTTSATGSERVVVQVNLKKYEEDRTNAIRLAVSKRIAPIGLRHFFLWAFCGAKLDWSRVGRRSVSNWCCHYPLSWIAPRNIWNFFTFRWTTWGKGDAKHQKEQIVFEQTTIGLVSGLMLTVSTAFTQNLLLPNVSVNPRSTARSWCEVRDMLCMARPPLCLFIPGDRRQKLSGERRSRRNKLHDLKRIYLVSV